MNNTQPLFDSTTNYRIALQGPVDIDWLQSFAGSVEITVEATQQLEDITLIRVNTDQSGIVGLLRKLHGLGMTILQLRIITRKEQ